MTSAKDVDAYIESAPAAAQPMLREIRRIILDSDAVLRAPRPAAG
jgi:hypothetical protein